VLAKYNFIQSRLCIGASARNLQEMSESSHSLLFSRAHGTPRRKNIYETRIRIAPDRFFPGDRNVALNASGLQQLDPINASSQKEYSSEGNEDVIVGTRNRHDDTLIGVISCATDISRLGQMI
jgi:hypothetical protein